MKLLSKPIREGIVIHLRSKFLIGVLVMQFLTMTGTILVVEHQMRTSILEEFLKLGMAISKNLSAVNASLVTTYNYVGIEQNVAQAVKENGLAYALIQFFDGEIAAYSGEESLKKTVIHSKVAENAFSDTDQYVRYFNSNNTSAGICELASPISIRDTKWATVRVGLSLEKIQAAIRKTRQLLFLLGIVALSFGCIVSMFIAGRITRPVASLIKDVDAVSKGDYRQEISIKTNDEIGYLAKRFSAMKESLKENIRLLKDSNAELTLTNQRLQSLFKASQAMNAFENQYRLYDLILDTALTSTDAYGASLLMVEPDATVRVVACVTRETENPLMRHVFQKLLKEQSFVRQFSSLDASLGSCSFNLEYLENTPFFRVSIGAYPDLEILSLPLGIANNIAGYINLVRNKKGFLTISEIQTLIVLASQTTTSIENNQLLSQLERAYLSSIKSLAKTLEFKDEYTLGHAERVAGLCKSMAYKMDLGDHEIRVIYNAALLHDIGKIGVLESILNKKSRLNNEEFRMIRKHPGIGEEILRPILTLEKERNIVRHHHEREDGRGYPDGLDGQQMSLSEKIIIAADAFDAMNSKRSYRDVLDHEVIEAELRNNSGKQFDRQVVSVLLEIFQDEICNSQKSPRVIFLPTVSAQ